MPSNKLPSSVFQEYTLDIIFKVALGKKEVEMFNNKYLDLLKDIFNRLVIIFSLSRFLLLSRINNYMQGFGAALPFMNKLVVGLLDFLGKIFSIFCPSPSTNNCRRTFQSLLCRSHARIGEDCGCKEERAGWSEFSSLLQLWVFEDAGVESKSADFIDIYLDAEVDGCMADIEVRFPPQRRRLSLFRDLVRWFWTRWSLSVWSCYWPDSTQHLIHSLTLRISSPIIRMCKRKREKRSTESVRERSVANSFIRFMISLQTVKYDSLAQLEYTNALIRETLRHYPLASLFVLPRGLRLSARFSVSSLANASRRRKCVEWISRREIW